MSLIDDKVIKTVESLGAKIANSLSEKQKIHLIESYFNSPSEILASISASARVLLHQHHEDKLGRGLSGGEAAELHKPFFGAGLSEAVLKNILPSVSESANSIVLNHLHHRVAGQEIPRMRDLPIVGKYIGATVDTARMLSLATLTVTIVADLSVEIVNRAPGAATAAQKYIEDTAKAASAVSILMVSSIVDACAPKILHAGSSPKSKSPKKKSKAKRTMYED